MSHTASNLLAHIIFSTKDRRPFLDAEIRPKLFAYMGGILRAIDAISFGVNGVADHVHALVKCPARLSMSNLIRTLKANSSRWFHEEYRDQSAFAWQAGYGAFSVSRSNVDEVLSYIAKQEEHHRHMTFQEEYLAFLERHGIPYDAKYIWD